VLTRARDALERGRLKRAVRDAWSGGQIAAQLNDERSLEQVIALGEAIRERATGRDEESAAMLVTYCTHCLADARAGVRRSASPLARFLSLGPSVPVKVCPDCAESIKAAAKICPYCRHAFR
jgi:hypothetical protein